ncbi:hypothetical protein LQV63_02290 [Paenibacillus profundus]|uniref:Type 4 fimbrial biogenesis protein PilX N-terminal domain-containing protein n=1 Tax=Paenibacillus profundus TaxID=1173085 RepID=A0ABS8YCS8_9BACL|nr:hypothetical protein [Paenibacillus profundus]MCE5168150.1 hypothetical protein [Paenibacillus profundus]
MNKLHLCLNILRRERGSAMMIVFLCMILLFLTVPLLLQVVGTGVVQQHLSSEQRIAQEITVGNMESYISYLNQYQRKIGGSPVASEHYRNTYAGMGNKTVQTGSGWSTTVCMNDVTDVFPDAQSDRFYMKSEASLQKGKKEMVYSFLKAPRFGETVVSPNPDDRDCTLDKLLLQGKFKDPHHNDWQDPPIYLKQSDDEENEAEDVVIRKHSDLQTPIGKFLEEKQKESSAMTAPSPDRSCGSKCQYDLSEVDKPEALAGETIALGNAVIDRNGERSSYTIGAPNRLVNIVGGSLTYDSYVNVEIYGNMHLSSLTLHNGGHLTIHGDLIIDGPLVASDWKNEYRATIERTVIKANRIIVKNKLEVNDNAQLLATELLYAENITTSGNSTVGGDRIVVVNNLIAHNLIFIDSAHTRDIIAGNILLQAKSDPSTISKIEVRGDILVKDKLTVNNNVIFDFGGTLAIGGNMDLQGSQNRLLPRNNSDRSTSIIIDGGICIGIPDWEPRREQ